MAAATTTKASTSVCPLAVLWIDTLCSTFEFKLRLSAATILAKDKWIVFYHFSPFLTLTMRRFVCAALLYLPKIFSFSMIQMKWVLFLFTIFVAFTSKKKKKLFSRIDFHLNAFRSWNRRDFYFDFSAFEWGDIYDNDDELFYCWCTSVHFCSLLLLLIVMLLAFSSRNENPFELLMRRLSSALEQFFSLVKMQTINEKMHTWTS